MLHVGLYIYIQMQEQYEFCNTANVPGVPCATVANTTLFCEYLRNWELKHKGEQEEEISSFTGKWYFVMEESTTSRLRRVDGLIRDTHYYI